jgi:general secretion pathway protein B
MSYILDALRRSDQQRQRGAVPTLLTAQAATAAPKQPAFLFYGVLAVVLVSAGIAIGWLRPWQPEPTAPATAPVAARPAESVPREIALTPPPALPEMANKPERRSPARKSTSAAQPAPAHAAIKQDTPEPAKTDKPATPPVAVTDVLKAVPTPTPEPSAAKGPANAAQEQKVMTMSELPLSIQQEMPAMSVSIHAYSVQPQNRLVGINERMLHEGDYAASGLRLEQITPDGMIFTYKGYRFSRGVRSTGSKADPR